MDAERDLYLDCCEASEYIRDMILEISKTLEEQPDAPAAGSLTEEREHLRTALSALLIVKARHEGARCCE